MFRFDKRLRDKEEISDLISDVWSRSNLGTVETKIRYCRTKLTKWTRERNQNNALVIKEAQVALEAAISSEVVV